MELKFQTEAGLEALVVLHEDEEGGYKWYCGYLTIPEAVYAKIPDVYDLDVHGGITFCEMYPPDPVYDYIPTPHIGFDCAHSGDTIDKCNLAYVRNELEQLAKQVMEFQC